MPKHTFETRRISPPTSLGELLTAGHNILNLPEAVNVSKSAETNEKPQSTWTTSPNKDTCRLPLPSGAQAHRWERRDEHPRCQRQSRQRMGKSETVIWLEDFKKAEPKPDLVQQAKKDGRPVHFASLMDLCHLKHSEPENISKQTRRESCAGRGNVKDESGNGAASQVAEARFLDTIF